MFQTNTSNFNSTNSKYFSSSNYQDFPVIKFTRMKKEKPSYFGSLEKTNYNSTYFPAGKNTNNNNNQSTYYSSSSYPELVLTNSTNKNFLESKKNFLLSTMYNKTKEEPFAGFFPKSKILSTIRKTEFENEKTDKNEKPEKEKSPEKYHIKTLEFSGQNKTKSNLNFNISTFISPSNKINYNNNNTNNELLYNNSSSQHIRENSNSNYNNTHTNQNNKSFLYSVNLTNNGFNPTHTHGSYINNPNKSNLDNNNNNNSNKVNFGTNTNLSGAQLNYNSEFKSVNSGLTSSRYAKNHEFIDYAKHKNSPTSYYNNCIKSNNNFSKFQSNSNNANNSNSYLNYNNNNFSNNQNEIEDIKNLKLRNTFNSSVFKSFNKFSKTQHSRNNNYENKNRSKEKKKVINMSDFDQFENYKENYLKMREEQFLKDTAYFIYDKFDKKKFKKFIFKEIPTNEYFKEIIDKITRLVEIKRNNNEFISVEYIVNMLRQEIESNSIAPMRMKNEDFLLPLINKKSSHADLEFENPLSEKNLFQRLKKSKNKFNSNYNNNNNNNKSTINNNKYFASCISEEVENYWENRNGRNDDSTATNLIKDKLKLNNENYIIKSKKKKKGKKKKSKNQNNGGYENSSSEDYESDSHSGDSYSSYSNPNTENNKQRKKRSKRRCSAGAHSNSSENSFLENENSESYMDQSLSELETKRKRRRRRKYKYANLPKTSDITNKLMGNLEVNLEKEMKFLNTQKNFFMKRLDSFMITQSSGFDGLSDNMLRKTLSILDKYGGKRRNKKKDKDRSSAENDAMASQLTDFGKIKAKENFENLIINNNVNNNNNTNNTNENNNINNSNSLTTNQNISPANRNFNLNQPNTKKNANTIISAKNSGGAAGKSPRKKLNLKDLKRKKSEANDTNKTNNNNKKTESNKNAETEGKNNTLHSNANTELLNLEGKLSTENNSNNEKHEFSSHLNNGKNETQVGTTKAKKTRKRTIKKLKEGCAEGAEEYEEIEIEETFTDDEDVNRDIENTEAQRNSPKDADVNQVDISNFKKFMMESLIIAPPAAECKDNQENTAEDENGNGGGNEGRKKKRKRNASMENGSIITEYSNESEDYEDSEDEIEEYISTEECLNTETGEIEIKRVKKTRTKKKADEENIDEELKAKKARRKKRAEEEAIYNPQLDMLLKMIQDEENKKQAEKPEHKIRVRRVIRKKTLALEPIDGLILTTEGVVPEEEEYEEVESDDTTESEKNRRAEKERIERERNEILKKKINDAYILGINQNLNFLMSQGINESDMTRYQDLLEKIESLKKLDPGNYMKNIKMLLEEFKREEQEIHELKKIERRINDFKYDLADERFRVGLARETKMSSLKMRDRTFNTTVSELSKNVIMQRKFTKMY